jgi:hypothetical protein
MATAKASAAKIDTIAQRAGAFMILSAFSFDL